MWKQIAYCSPSFVRKCVPVKKNVKVKRKWVLQTLIKEQQVMLNVVEFSITDSDRKRASQYQELTFLPTLLP
jgi:hypothetical protein